jgi:RNA polymerase-binding transcription factor DksA
MPCLRALAADGLIDQVGRGRADVARQSAGQVCVVAVRVRGAAHGVLEDANHGKRVDGACDACGARIGKRRLRGVYHQR